MKRYIKSSNDANIDNTIHVVMYLKPIFYSNSKIFSSISFDKNDGRYHTDINPNRIINGPLSGPGEELEPPIKDEWEDFVEDCKYLVTELGFTIIDTSVSIESKKSTYIITYGIEGRQCGTLVYDLRISDHPYDATFPEDAKDTAEQYLKMNKVLDGSATKANIDFQVEKVTVGTVTNDTWDRAFNRLYNLLRRMKRKVIVKYNKDNNI